MKYTASTKSVIQIAHHFSSRIHVQPKELTMANHIAPHSKIIENIKTCIHFSTELIKAASIPTLPAKTYAYPPLLSQKQGEVCMRVAALASEASENRNNEKHSHVYCITTDIICTTYFHYKHYLRYITSLRNYSHWMMSTQQVFAVFTHLATNCFI